MRLCLLMVHALPRLKLLDEFKNCSTIVDFGREFLKFRFSSENKTASWEKYFKHCKRGDFDIESYARSYESYVYDNINGIVDKIYENTNSGGEQVKDAIKQAVLDGWGSLSKGGLASAGTIARQGFRDSLIVAMNRLGVK